ncbi:YfkD family protein [Virgibacillus kimchii]
MNASRYMTTLLFFIIFALMLPIITFGEEEKAEEKEGKGDFEIPSHVLSIEKENTHNNTAEDQEVVEPSELTRDLIEEMDIPIKNPDLIKTLNETTLNPSPIAIGYRGEVFIGRWPLNYKSTDTRVNWEYQSINKNEINNLGGNANQELNYTQQEQKEIQGALTNKISRPEEVKKMMLLHAEKTTQLPLSFNTVVGRNTKKTQSYQVPAEKYGILEAFAPAVSEKGEVTFGEVYIKLKGSNKSIEIKNVTKQGVGAWIPIQDHVSFSYNVN